MAYTYDLRSIEENDMSLVYNDQDGQGEVLDALKLKQRLWRHNDSTYKIVKYDKELLTFDRVHTSGLFRSVIHRNGKILVFTPPKAESPDTFQRSYNPEECYAEEYVEGTMINLFYDEETSQWEIATRSCVGAKATYFRSGQVKEENTFSFMFMEACNDANFSFDSLPKEYCYTFVFQHPLNRIVTPFTQTALYLISVFKVDGYKVTQLPRENFRSVLPETIKFPQQYTLESYEQLREEYSSQNTDYKCVGAMIVHKNTGSRTKIRNPNYEFVRQLRGNQPKLQYTYISLRQSGKVNDYIRFYPEVKKEFALFREQIHSFTNQLHSNYIMCYIKKTKPLKEYPFQFRSHMFALHSLYIDVLREQKYFVNRATVIKYINELYPAKLMFSLNYCMRQQQVDELKVSV